MIRRAISKRIIVASIALLILLITYMFPTTQESTSINQTLSYTEPNKSTIYLLDSTDMVARTTTIIIVATIIACVV